MSPEIFKFIINHKSLNFTKFKVIKIIPIISCKKKNQCRSNKEATILLLDTFKSQRYSRLYHIIENSKHNINLSRNIKENKPTIVQSQKIKKKNITSFHIHDHNHRYNHSHKQSYSKFHNQSQSPVNSNLILWLKMTRKLLFK